MTRVLKKDFILAAFVFIVIELSVLTHGNQICQAFDEGSCPKDTCCKESECQKEGGTYTCCEQEGPGCSNCLKCINCEWTEWSACGKLEEQCGDGSMPQKVRGEKTRKYKQQAGPGGIECVAAVIEGQNRLTKAPCYHECPVDNEDNPDWNHGYTVLIIVAVIIVALVGEEWKKGFIRKKKWKNSGDNVMLLISSGPANQKQSMCMGRYKKIPEYDVSVENKPVWRHEQHSGYLCSVDNQWMVTDTPLELGDNRIKYGCKCADSTRPDDVPKGNWMFYDDNKWIIDPDLNVYSSYD